jgi:predicted O-linked N-acetylglucosamine transferase (SPINDLY family)
MGELGPSQRVGDRLKHATDCAAAGDWTAARGHCVSVLQTDPRNSTALHILGGISSCEGDFKSAEEFLRRAIALEPHQAGWLRDLGALHITAGNLPCALDALSRSLALDPADVGALSLLARALWESGETETALPIFERWSLLAPKKTGPWLGAARCLVQLNRSTEATARVRRALKLDRDCAPAHQLMAQIHFRRREHDRALIHRLELLRLAPENSSALAAAAAAYYELGDVDAAVSLFRRALSAGLSPRSHAFFLAVLLHHPLSNTDVLVKEHKHWAKCHGAAPPVEPAFSIPPLIGRRMRIAYLCTEPATSPIFRFVPPLLRNHDRDHFEICLYSNDSSLAGHANRAGVTEAELKNVAAWPERRIAEQIRRDSIDILVNLCGHFGDGGLLVSSMRAAPIQVAYPNYQSTTGIPEMDYIFTDRWTCPPGQESQYTEEACVLDSGYLVYDPPESAPRPGPLPANKKTGAVTFGFFQRPPKMNARVWDAIAEILNRVPRSGLLVHFASADLDSKNSMSRLRLASELKARQIDPARVRFRGMVDYSRHLRLISGVDLALDSFPYTGQTTTCECLWMGVPVVTLAGDIHRSRTSAGILLRAGLDHLVAHDIEDYIGIAVRMASDLTALAELRKSLRWKVRESTVADGARLAREVEAAYQWMWQQRFRPPSTRY